jgi:hypothetical protein
MAGPGARSIDTVRYRRATAPARTDRGAIRPQALHWSLHRSGDKPLAKPNYSYEKRQRELAKKKQQDAKDARKREAREAAKPATAQTDRPAE